jgi:hypothetical protein
MTLAKFSLKPVAWRYAPHRTPTKRTSDGLKWLPKKLIIRCALTIAIYTMDDQLPLELQHAFEEAIAKYSRWQSGDEPTVSYQMQDRSISSICNLMTFYENVPLRPAIMALLTAVAGERHADLKNDLENNYASAGQYLLRLIEYRKERHSRRDQ